MTRPLAALMMLAAMLSGCVGSGPRAPEAARTDPSVTGPRCAATPAPTVVAADARRHRIAAVAVAEWQRWGSLDVARTASGEPCACLGPDRCIPVDDGCGREQQTPWCPIVNEYWRRTFVVSGRWFHHDCGRVDVCESRWPDGLRPIATPAWSAAFVSTMLDRAGVGDDAFLKTPYHADYVRAAMDGRTPGWHVAPVPAAVAVGDLVCSSRVDLLPAADGPYRFEPLVAGGLPWFGAGAPYPATAARRITAIVDTQRSPRPTPMHCDIVVALERPQRSEGAAVAIGGNVMQAVARVRYPLDERGRVVALGTGAPLLVMQWRDGDVRP